MTYVEPDLIDDETAVAEGILASIADRFEGWEPAEAHIATALSEAIGIALATAAVVFKADALDAYLGFGQRILRLERGAAAVATAISTWTFDTTDEATLEAGTEAELALPDGGTVTFAVPGDIVKAAGTYTLTGVILEAVEAGPESNGATNPATSDDLANVLAVTIDTPAAGGADAEDPEDYANRVADRARRLHLIPITPADHAAFATDVPGIHRAVGINLLDPAHPGVETTGHLTVVAADENGELATPLRDALQAYFDAIERPLNVTVHVVAPAEVDLAITATVRPKAGADDLALQSAAEAAIAAALDKGEFDADPTADGGWAQERSTEVTIFDVAASIDDLDTLAAVVDVHINGGTAPVALPAPVSLPNVTAVTVTVAA